MTPNLTAYLIDRDRSAIGQAVSAVFASSTQQSATPALGWVNVDPDVMPKNADVVESVLDERAWIAVVGTFSPLLLISLYSLFVTLCSLPEPIPSPLVSSPSSILLTFFSSNSLLDTWIRSLTLPLLTQ